MKKMKEMGKRGVGKKWNEKKLGRMRKNNEKHLKNKERREREKWKKTKNKK